MPYFYSISYPSANGVGNMTCIRKNQLYIKSDCLFSPDIRIAGFHYYQTYNDEFIPIKGDRVVINYCGRSQNLNYIPYYIYNGIREYLNIFHQELSQLMSKHCNLNIHISKIISDYLIFK
jgi:hypothetical protein